MLVSNRKDWSGRRDLNSGPPAPKAGVLPFRSPSLAIPHMKIKELSREIVVVGCGWKCLRMHGVPVIFTTAKTTRKQRKCEASIWGRGVASAMPDVSKYGSNSLRKNHRPLPFHQLTSFRECHLWYWPKRNTQKIASVAPFTFTNQRAFCNHVR